MTRKELNDIGEGAIRNGFSPSPKTTARLVGRILELESALRNAHFTLVGLSVGSSLEMPSTSWDDDDGVDHDPKTSHAAALGKIEDLEEYIRRRKAEAESGWRAIDSTLAKGES